MRLFVVWHIKRNTLTLHMYLYSNNSFLSEAKVCNIYTNEYYLCDKEYCIEHVNVLNRMYILTSYLLKLVIILILFCHLCLCLPRSLFPSVLYVIIYWENIFQFGMLMGAFGDGTFTCRTSAWQLYRHFTFPLTRSDTQCYVFITVILSI